MRQQVRPLRLAQPGVRWRPGSQPDRSPRWPWPLQRHERRDDAAAAAMTSQYLGRVRLVTLIMICSCLWTGWGYAGAGACVSWRDGRSRRRERVRHRVEQPDCVAVLRVLQDLLGRSALDDAPLVQHEQLVGDHARAEQVVRDVEQAEAALAAQLGEQLAGRRPGARRRASRPARPRRSAPGRRRARGRSATRWRWPPESWCGSLAANWLAGVRPTVSSSSPTRSPASPCRHGQEVLARRASPCTRRCAAG